MSKYIIFFSALLMAFSHHLYAFEKSVTVSTVYNYPPFCFKDKNTELIQEEIIFQGKDSLFLKGYSWDVTRESFQAMGYAIKLIVAPWARAELYVKQGSVEVIFPAVLTKKRLKKYVYSKHYTDRQNFLIYAPKDSDFQWDGLNSMKGKTIIKIFKWSFGEKFSNAKHFPIHKVYSIMEGLKILARGRVDGMVGYEISFDHIIKTSGLEGKFKKLPPFDFSDEFLIALKSNQKAQKKLKDFDKGWEIISKNGMLENINKKWLLK